MSLYRALSVNKDATGIKRSLVVYNYENLPSSDLIIEVNYSGLNYIDAYIASGYYDYASYPLVPGIDASGTVVESNVDSFKAGDEVLVTGSGLGSTMPGGFGAYISVPASIVLPIPVGLTMRTSMALGTAGIVAGMFKNDLTGLGIKPGSNKIAVTGASCGAGAVATAILTQNGYDVTAYVHDLSDSGDYVKKLGANEIKPMSSLNESKGKTLMPPIYDGVLDTVGGEALASIIKYAGNNALISLACYNLDMALLMSLHPFIERGVNLSGLNSVNCATDYKLTLWQKLASDWRIPYLDWLCTEVSLEELDEYIPLMLERKIKGRILINHKI